MKSQRKKSMDEILEILREEEMTSCSQGSRTEGIDAGIFYSRKNRRSNLNVKLCYIYRLPNHLSKDCFYRNNKSKTDVLNQRKKQRNFSNITRKEQKIKTLCSQQLDLITLYMIKHGF